MTATTAGGLSSSQPDLKLLGRLAMVRQASLLIAGLISGTVLLAWFVPAVGNLLPTGWALMKANTAFCFLLAVAGLLQLRHKRGEPGWLHSRAVALVVLLVAGSSLFEHLSGHAIGIDTWLAADATAEIPGRMSLQTAIFLSMLAVTLFVVRARGSLAAHAVDAFSAGLLVLTMVIFAGYCFGAARLFGQSMSTRTSPQTLLCMVLLTFVVISRRAEYGFFSVLVGSGIGSRIARTVLPFAMLLPFLLVMGGAYSAAAHWLSTEYAAALTASTTSLALFSLILLMALRINILEHELRDMSLTDELTRIYNRRGFNLLSEQAWRDARRADQPLSVLYFDLDGLKKVNDSFGHDAGSTFVADMARLLSANFRDADIVARVGGDEFAVVMRGDHEQAVDAIRRLDQAAAAANQANDRPYRIAYSSGEATSYFSDQETIGELVARADAKMYERKRAKSNPRIA